jgi:hypothetical protein
MGVFCNRIGGRSGESCWAHSGFWGTTVVHCPASDVTLALTVNQGKNFDVPSQRFLATILRLVSQPRAKGCTNDALISCFRPSAYSRWFGFPPQPGSALPGRVVSMGLQPLLETAPLHAAACARAARRATRGTEVAARA